MPMRTGAVAPLAFFIAVLAPGFQLQAAEPARYEFEEPHMGTRFRVVLHAVDKEAAITAATAAFKRVRELESVLSDYRASSEIMRLCTANDREPGIARAVSDDLATVLDHALEVSRLTDGAFDVTVGPLSKLWREARKTKVLPDHAARRAARELVGWKWVELDREKKTVRLAKAGMRIDFGGIGKGFAADEALAVLKSNGFSRSLVAAAGDITVGDPPPGKTGWTVEIEPLGADQPRKSIHLANASVSTSGDLYQFVEIGGTRYSHLLDPRTGFGLTGYSRATVIAKKGWQADAWTKGISLLPPETAKAKIDEMDGAAMFLVTRKNATAPEVKVESRRYADYLAR